MAIDSYATLQETVISMDGSNAISSFLDVAIQMAESEMYANSIDILQIREMEAVETTALSIVDQFLPLPDRFISMRRLQLSKDSVNYNLQYVTPDAMRALDTVGFPNYFTVTNQIEFDRIADEAYVCEIQHIAYPAPLSDTNTTNIVLDEFPNIYLFGTLWAVNQFNAEQELAEYYYGKFISAIQGANAKTEAGKYGPSPRMRMRVAVN